MKASVRRMAGLYRVEVGAFNAEFFNSAQEAADWLADNYPGIVTEWNV